jgi:dolichol-phosphate mannosyltransferase
VKICITIPTYNEAENIADLVKEIRTTVPEADILVVDDNSPDGTSGIVAELAQSDGKVHLMTRTTDRGRGRAGRDGFLWALEHGAAHAIEMDADFSHHPRYLPAILEAAKSADVVLGSRYVKGGKETGRPAHRQWITKLVGTFLRASLGVKVRDPSSGYRCWSRHALEQLDMPQLLAVGPSIVSEMLYKARLKNLKMVEVPIVFEDRVRGSSKLDFKTLLRTLNAVFELRKQHKQGKF